MFKQGNIKYVYAMSKRYRQQSWRTYACGRVSSKQQSSKVYYSRLQIPEDLVESCDLKNGMRIFSEKTKSSMTTVGCFLPAGAMYETQDERGAALFLEHLMFRKTKRRQENEIEEELGEIGGKIRAVAMKDMFLFYGTAPNEGVEKLVELFADAVICGFICSNDFMFEKLLIIKEMFTMENNEHEKVVMDYLTHTAYQDTQLSKSIYPDTCEIRNLTVDKIECFRERLFRTYFMTMVSTGGTSLCELYKFTEKHFLCSGEDFKTNEGPCKLKMPIPMPNFRFTGGEMRLRDDDEKLGHVAIAIEGPGYKNCNDHCTLNVMKEIVGSWDLASAGAQHNAPYIAHEAFNSDLCYKYKSFNIGWKNTGLWGCYFACDRMKLENMIETTQREWMRLCTSITEKEVERAVNECKTKELVKLSDPVQKFIYIASCLFYRGAYEPCDHRITKYERVSSDLVKQIANKYIYDQCPAVAAIGPVENLSDYILIRSNMYLLRY